MGAAIGFGMLSKYSMPFLVAGIGVGVIFGPLRAHLRSKWLYLGAALALLIFLPNFLWQWQHDFISLEFLRPDSRARYSDRPNQFVSAGPIHY